MVSAIVCALLKQRNDQCEQLGEITFKRAMRSIDSQTVQVKSSELADRQLSRPVLPISGVRRWSRRERSTRQVRTQHRVPGSGGLRI